MGDVGSGKETKREEGEIMDTPERSKNCQIATSISKFEESPVFNFLNNLSPIRPVKSTHVTQTIIPLSFASVPSVFTSPHVRSLRESRVLRRHPLSDPSKPEFSSDDHDTMEKKMVNTVTNVKPSDEEKGNLDPSDSHNCVKFVIDLSEEYNCNSPESSIKGRNLRLVPFVPEPSRVDVVGLGHNVDLNKEKTSCDWEDLIDTSDLLTFESPAVEGSQHENLYTQAEDGNETTESDGVHDLVMGYPNEEMDYEHLSSLCRGMRKRCLVYEMGGSYKKHLDENLASHPSEDHQLLGENTESEPSCSVLPGIGLHLNALAFTPKDQRLVSQDSLNSRKLLIGPCSSLDFHLLPTAQETLSNSNSSSLEIEVDVVETNAGQPSGFVANEENYQSASPRTKRRKMEQPGEEGGVCKRCNCKKSKCLKLYCECFAAGVYCVEPCACIDCFNKPVHEDTVLTTRKQIESRNPLAFAPKVIMGPDYVSETGDESSKTPASARHKRGCNCKKSGCFKKYCECYQGGVGCSINCRCEGCKNVFGRKDGSGAISIEVEHEESKMDMAEESTVDRSFQKCTVKEMNVEHTALPETPLQAGRLQDNRGACFPSTENPSRSSRSSIFQPRQTTCSKQSVVPPPPPPKFKNHFETIEEDDMIELLEDGGLSSPISSGIKVSSPNGKRVSPPHNTQRSTRALILRSIPSFPSLAQNQ